MTEIRQFIEKELAQRRTDYLSSPTYLIEHYESERQNIQAYNGRQLLEMLQNADDASEIATNKTIHIELKDNILKIANNGEPFDEDGFRSILYSSVSSKRLKRNKIGQKGLGFRALLSWAEEVIISSNKTNVEFSETIAESFLDELLNENSELRNFIKQKSNTQKPIAILRVPRILNGESGIDTNYDTTISIKLKESVIDDVQSQIESVINKETLVFLNNIGKIIIDSPKRHIVFEKLPQEGDKNRVTVESRSLIDNRTETKTWNLNRAVGKHKDKDFELAIAWNDELSDAENVLYSYFKTEVRFPFPALLHGTFELTQDRKHLEKDTDGHNEFLIGKLSELLIETALKIASTNDASYLPLKLLNIEFDKVDTIIETYKFKDTLIDKIKSSHIFPNVNNKYITYSEKPVFYPSNVASFIRGEDANNLMPACTDEAIVKFITTFSPYQYTVRKYLSIIASRTTTLHITELAYLVHFLLEHKKYQEDILSNDFKLSDSDEFLPDTDNKAIKWTSSIFLQPGDNVEFNLPKALNIRFLNQDFIHALLQQYKKSDNEFLLDKLKPFGIRKYSFIDIAEAIVKHYTAKNKIDKNDVQELHQFLFQLFKSEEKKGEPQPLFLSADVPVISRNHKVQKARSVYFGKYYNETLTEQLYKYNKTMLLADPKEMGLAGLEEGRLKNYLKWLGVAALPRTINIVNGPSEFAEYAFKKYDYKKNIVDYPLRSYEEFKVSRNSYGKISVQSVDDLDELLKHNKCEVILAWICADERIYRLIDGDSEPENSSIEVHFGRDRDYRHISGKRIRNYFRWKISNTPWLNTESGIKKAPVLCTTSATITGEFSPLIEKPDVDYDAEILKEFNVNRDKVDFLLHLVGVNKTISSFETKLLYQILNKLPEIDLEGKKAKTLYRELAVNYEEKYLDTSDAEYQKFIANGKVFCSKQGKYAYEYNNSAFYVVDKRYGESIISQFNTIVIDKRRGQDKVEKVFGVKTLKGLKLTLVGNPSRHVMQGKFEQEIESFKPYVYVFRQEADSSGREKNAIKDARFVLVTELSVMMEREKEKVELKLAPYEYLEKNRTIYIQTPEHLDDEKRLKEDYHFCSAVAEAFSVLINVDEQRKQIIMLFSKPALSRDEIIGAELDDANLEKLASAREKLGIVNNPKRQFWLSFVKCYPSKKYRKEKLSDDDLLSELKTLFPNVGKSIADVYDKINYENYNEESSLRYIVDLLIKAKLSLRDLNRYVYPSIDISELYELDFKRLREAKKPDFKKSLYLLFINNGERDKTDFLKELAKYDTMSGSFKKDINCNIEGDFIAQLHEQFSIELSKKTDVDLQQVFVKNKAAYEEKADNNHISKELAAQFLNEHAHYESLLYFDTEIESLVQKLLGWVQAPLTKGNGGLTGPTKKHRIRIGDKAFYYDDYTDLLHQLEKDGTFQANLSRIKIKKYQSQHTDKTKKPKKKPSKKPKQPSEDLGFLGEWVVYNHLLSNAKNKESIKWVSEYAKLAGVNLDGKDGLGYDFEYIPNDAKYPRYVEAKLAGWEDAFHISANEVSQGEKLKKHFEIFLVRNLADPANIEIEVIQAPFDYKGQNSFTDNDLFTVINDSFILKFEKKDE